MLTTEKRDPPEEDDSQSKKLQYKITKCKFIKWKNFFLNSLRISKVQNSEHWKDWNICKLRQFLK